MWWDGGHGGLCGHGGFGFGLCGHGLVGCFGGFGGFGGGHGLVGCVGVGLTCGGTTTGGTTTGGTTTGGTTTGGTVMVTGGTVTGGTLTGSGTSIVTVTGFDRVGGFEPVPGSPDEDPPVGGVLVTAVEVGVTAGVVGVAVVGAGLADGVGTLVAPVLRVAE